MNHIFLLLLPQINGLLYLSRLSSPTSALITHCILSLPYALLEISFTIVYLRVYPSFFISTP